MIGITGTTGGVGARAVRHLLAAPGHPPLVAIARRPEAVVAGSELTVRRADYDDPESLEKAFDRIRTLVFVSSDGRSETMLRHHHHVVDAAAEAGVEHVVYTSIMDVAADSPFYYSPVHQETEAMLGAFGISSCLARTSVFADFFASTWLAPALDAGTLALPIGDGALSLVSREDVARAIAAAALAETVGTVELTGPTALTADDICRAAEAATGRPMRFTDIDEEQYRTQLRDQGEPDWLVSAFTSMFRSVREGRFAAVEPGVSDLTGREPQPTADFLREWSTPR